MFRNKINLYLIQYAINAILRQRSKNSFIFIIFTLLISLLTSIFLISNSIKYELNLTVDSLPQIIVQKIKGGKIYDIETSVTDDILNIAGVTDVIPRVWGYYYFANAKVNFTLIGLNNYENQYKNSLDNIIKNYTFDESSMIIGSGVKKIMNKNYYKDYFNFIKPDGTLKKITINGIFNTNIQLEANDIIILSQDNAREIFDMDEESATDIVVKVANKNEINTIIEKIKILYPDTKIISNDNLKESYEKIFNYKSGLFLSIFVICLFTFFIIIYDKANGLNSEEKKEIGILKATGWTIDDILKEKFYESFIISFSAYLLGIILAFSFVYILQAPLLKNIFIGYSQLKPDFILPFIFDFQTLFLVFFLSIPIYISATILPSWKAATLEIDEIIR